MLQHERPGGHATTTYEEENVRPGAAGGSPAGRARSRLSLPAQLAAQETVTPLPLPVPSPSAPAPPPCSLAPDIFAVPVDEARGAGTLGGR